MSRIGRTAANAPTTLSVVRRLLVRRPTRRPGPAYDGNLTEAIAAARGPALRAHLEGELAVLTPPELSPRTSTTSPGTDREAADSAPNKSVILHLVTNSLPETVAGYTVRTHGLAVAQRQHGVDAHVLTRLGFPVTKGHVDAAALVEVDGVPYHRLLSPVPLRADRARARDIELTSALVQRLRPDVLHAHSNHLNAQVALAVGRRFGLPVVYEVRGFLEETWASRGHSRGAESYRLARAAEAWAMRHADAVTTLSESMREAIVARGIDPAKVRVTPNAVDAGFAGFETLVPRSSTGESPRSSTSDGFTIGTVGTLNHYEGLDLLLDAAARVPGVRVLIVGDGPARADLEHQARRLGLHATFTGRVSPDRVAAYHLELDVFCVPRRDLPVTRLVPPLKPVEAMALGRPVIASDLPPLRELVTHGHTGLLVAPDDVEALATAIGTLARRADARHQLGQNAREFVRAHRTWTAVHHTLTDLYASLTEGALHV
jgi:glycosyltransferase involved in cell wall biosynthesis